MVLHCWDLNSSSTTITTPWLLSCGWWRLCLQYPTFHTKILIYKLIQPFHSISTLPIYHHKYEEWLEKIEIGICALELWSQCVFEAWVGSKLAYLHLSTFRTEIVWVWTGPSNSQQLNPSNLSPLVKKMTRQGWDWNSSSTTIITPWLIWVAWVVKILAPVPTFHTKIPSVQTDSAISYQVNPSNLSF